MAGEKGRVIGIDKSEHFIDFLQKVTNQFSLNIEAQCADFDTMQLSNNSLDGIYCRWALAWISNPQEIINKLHKTLNKSNKYVSKYNFISKQNVFITELISLETQITECRYKLCKFQSHP